MYQVVGDNTKKIYEELHSFEECHRYLLKKFPSERMSRKKLVVVNPVLPEPMKILRK